MKIPPKFLTVEEVEKVFKTIGSDRRYRLIFAFYIYTGMRREEISRLQWKDINLKDDIITVLQTKNYESRTIPISEKLKNILKEYYSGANIGKVVDITLAQIGRGMKYFLRKAALLEVRPHDLRHTFASHLIMSGVDIKTVGELLGHKSLQATHIYVHLLSSHKIKAISKLPY